nr:VWA domain-containing protein [Prosthecobacter dejongeii]
MALAEPDLEGDERKDLLIIVDHSASMSAKEDGQTRLERAQQKARELITALHGSQRAAVASMADRLTMRAQPTRHRRSLLEAVDSIQPSQLPSQSEALRAVHPGQEGLKNTRVILITDGCVDDASLLSQVEVLKIPSEAPNIGIVRADLRPVPGEGLRLGLFVVMQSTFKETVSVDLMLRHEDSHQLVKLIPLQVKPGLNAAVTLTLEDAQTGNWTASIEKEDALILDNQVWLHVPTRDPLPVGVLAENAFFLENAVRAFERSEQNLQLATDAKQARLFLAMGRAPATGSALIFQPQGESLLWSELGDELKTIIPRVLLKDHALLRYLDAETMNFTGARKLKAPSGSVILVADESGVPLIYLVRQGEANLCVVNLDPLAAQFYLSAWFPVLTHNAASHLSHREAALPATFPTGSLTRIPSMSVEDSAQVRTPTGQSFVLPADESLRLEQVGFYQAQTKEQQTTVACSLISPTESSAARASLQSTTRPLAQGQSPSYWLLVLGLVALVGESALYHRRKVG